MTSELEVTSMRVVMPGSAGFVGRNLVRVLIEEGFKPENIIVIDKDQENINRLEKYQVETCLADLSEKGKWMREFDGADEVVNLAAQISSPEYEPFHRNNILATENIIEASRDAGIRRIIHFSSIAVLSVRRDHYAQTKLEGEELVKTSGLEYCVLRPSIMYGPTNDKNIGYLIRFSRAFPFFPIPGHGKWPRQPIYVDDVCRLVISIMKEFPTNEVLDINGKDVVYFRDMIRTVHRQLNGFKFELYVPVRLFKLLMMSYQKVTGDAEFTVDQVNSLTAEEVFPDYPWWEEFDIEFTPFEEGVRKMMDADA